MGYEKGRGLGKVLQGRVLPIQVVKREGKGAVGRYGNEDPNGIKPTYGNKLESSESKQTFKKRAASTSVPQWRKQQREVLSFKKILK